MLKVLPLEFVCWGGLTSWQNGPSFMEFEFLFVVSLIRKCHYSQLSAHICLRLKYFWWRLIKAKIQIRMSPSPITLQMYFKLSYPLKMLFFKLLVHLHLIWKKFKQIPTLGNLHHTSILKQSNIYDKILYRSMNWDFIIIKERKYYLHLNGKSQCKFQKRGGW